MGVSRRLRIAINKINPALGVSLLYFKQYKRFPNLRQPKLYNEKLQWLKLHVYGHDPLYTICADKYKVREYLNERGFGELLIPLIGVYDRPEDIDFDSLPRRFVLKWNFGCGYNIICNDKSELDPEATVRQLREWGRDKDYHWVSYEMQYRDVPRRIVCEANIAPEGERLLNYKFHCYKGSVLVGFTTEFHADGRISHYSFDKNLDPVPNERASRRHAELAEPSVGFDRQSVAGLIEKAESLAEPFPYVRVDLYSVGGRIYFGEFTFTDGGGFDRREPEADVKMGAALDLDAYRTRMRK